MDEVLSRFKLIGLKASLNASLPGPYINVSADLGKQSYNEKMIRNLIQKHTYIVLALYIYKKMDFLSKAAPTKDF